MAVEQLRNLEEFGGIVLLVEEGAKKVDHTDTLQAFSRDLEEKHQEYFDTAKGPSGDSWPPLAPSTVRRKGHDTILVDTGRLRSSLTGKSSDAIRDVFSEGRNQGMTFGTSVEYAIFHQEGTGRIPQRAHVGVTEKMVDDLADKIASDIVEGMKLKVG